MFCIHCIFSICPVIEIFLLGNNAVLFLLLELVYEDKVAIGNMIETLVFRRC